MNKKRTKKLLKILLCIVIISLIISLITSIASKIYIQKYKKIEKEYLNAASYIYENNAIEGATEKERIILTRKEINSLLTPPAIDNTCNGYVEIYPDNQGPEYKVYITCENKYTTKGYQEDRIL